MALSVFIFQILCLLPLVFGGVIPHQDSIEDYIVGGNETDIEKVPYQIALLIGNRFVCGGSIISPTHVITAAHCVSGYQGQTATNYNIRSGSRSRVNGGAVTPVKNVFSHPQFSMKTVDYDIAVLELETPLKFNNATQPIKIGEKEPADGASVLVSGWGCLKENGLCPVYLQSVTVPMVNRTVCGKNYEKFMKITSRMICAGMEGKDACQGDSGGPLAYNGNLVGVVSTGVGCARKDFPGIYTNIADPEIRAFIKKHANM